MASDKIKQDDVLEKSVPKSFEQLNKELEKSVKLMAQLSKSAIDLKKNFNAETIKDVTDNQKKYNETNEESQKTNKKAIDNLEKLREKIKAVSEEEERAKIALQEKRKAIRDNIKAQKDHSAETIKLTRELKKEIKTEKQATEQNKRLSKARKEIDSTTAKGAKQISLINKQIDKNNTLLKNNASQLGKQKIEIGRYKEGIKEALGEQEFFGVSLNNITSGLKSGVGTIAAISAVVVGLGKAYTSSARGAEDMARASDRLGTITKSLGNTLADATGEIGIFDGFVRIVQTKVLGLASTIYSDLQVAILSTIRQLEILDADQERQKKAQLDRAEVLRQIRDEERNSFEERKKANDDLGKVINERESETIAHQEKILKNLNTLLSFNEGDLEIQRQIKQVEFEIADAREEAQGFRSEMLINDLGLSREYIANELELQKIKIDGELNSEEIGIEEKIKLRKKLIEITKQLELQAAGENEQLQQIAIQKAINQEQEILNGRILAQKNLTQETEKETMARQEIFAEDLAKVAEIETEAFEEKLEREIEQEEALADAKIQEINREAEARIEADEEKKASTKQYIGFAVSAAQQLSDSIISYRQKELNFELNAELEKAKARGASEEEIAQIEKKYAKKRQNLAITQAIINTALGITAALANPGGILGMIIASLTAVTGAMEVAAIKSQHFAKGTDDSGSQWIDATVGEIGTEKINFADGTSMYTPNTSTKMMLPPHSEVIPNNMLQNELAQVQASGKVKNNTQESENRKREHKELIKAIKNRDETKINITESGFAVTANKGNSYFKYINRTYRS